MSRSPETLRRADFIAESAIRLLDRLNRILFPAEAKYNHNHGADGRFTFRNGGVAAHGYVKSIMDAAAELDKQPADPISALAKHLGKW
ncbi:MAG: hypothetical protein ACXU8O_02240 [Asticcacaulis sp.]